MAAKDDATRLVYYFRSVELHSADFSSRIQISRAWRRLGALTKSEAVLRDILNGQPPHEVREFACAALVHHYREAASRQAAVQTKRGALELVGGIQLCFAAKALAEREEEIGDYEAASGHFMEADNAYWEGRRLTMAR